MPSELKRRDRDTEWNVQIIPTLAGGLQTGLPDDLIPDEAVADIENLSIRDIRLRSDTGYARIGKNTTLRGVPKGSFEHTTATGIRTTLLVTDSSVYEYVPGANRSIDEWHYVPDGNNAGGRANNGQTTLSGAEAAGQTTLSVADTATFLVNDYVGVELDTGGQHQSQVTAIPTPGAPGEITINDELPSDAGAGNTVVKAYDLAGNNDRQVVFTAIPSQEWTAFTNGVDFPARYDGTDVRDIPGLSTVLTGVSDTCRTMWLFESGYLMLGNMVEAGTERPYRVRWCDTGDPSTWNDGDANFNDLLDATDDIVSMFHFDEDLVIGRKRSIVRCTFVGVQDNVFDFETIIAGIVMGPYGLGPLSANAIVPTDNTHYIQAQDGIYTYRNSPFVQSQSGDISNDVFENVFSPAGDFDRSAGLRSFGHFLDYTNEIYFFYTTRGGTFPDRALVLDTEKGTWRKRVFQREITFARLRQKSDDEAVRIIDLVGTIQEQTWPIGGSATRSGAPLALIGSTDGFVYEIDFLSTLEHTSAIPWTVTTKKFHPFDRYLRVDYIEVEYQGFGFDVFRVEDDGSISMYGTLPLSITKTKGRIYKQFVDRAVQIKIDGNEGTEIGRVSFAWKEESEWAF